MASLLCHAKLVCGSHMSVGVAKRVALAGCADPPRGRDVMSRPGEGTFFGLACSIKFPTDLSGAPYTLVARAAVRGPVVPYGGVAIVGGSPLRFCRPMSSLCWAMLHVCLCVSLRAISHEGVMMCCCGGNNAESRYDSNATTPGQATGASMLPQRMSFPFSLLTPPSQRLEGACRAPASERARS